MKQRWLIKKTARLAVALGSAATGSLTMRRIVRTPRARVLTYHRFAREPTNEFAIAPEVFEAQMRDLAEQKLAISIDRLEAFVHGREALPHGACLVTIDDGFLSAQTEALPVLRRWGVPAVAFITASLVDSSVRYPEPHLSWDELRELVRSGLFVIGSHGFTHRSMGRLGPEEARREARASREILERELGVPVTAYAYPYGTRADFNPYTERALADAGYTIAFNSMHGTIRPGIDPISLPRVKVEGGEALWMFRLLRHGAMDAWRAVDHTLWRVQRAPEDVVTR